MTRSKVSRLHRTVFPDRAVSELALGENGIAIDATFGEGGHSRLILEAIGEGGKLIVLDRDPVAVKKAETLKKTFFQISPFHLDFKELGRAMELVGLQEVHGILFDLGLSQDLIEESGRGFSFLKDEKLDMRMNPNDSLTAYEIVNRYPEDDIRKIIETFGEDYRARRIAKAIVSTREKGAIETTTT